MKNDILILILVFIIVFTVSFLGKIKLDKIISNYYSSGYNQALEEVVQTGEECVVEITTNNKTMRLVNFECFDD